MQPPIQGEKIEILNQQLNCTTTKNELNSTRQQYQIEAGVMAGFVIMFIELIFGLLRQKSTNSFVQSLLWLASSTSYTVVNTTIGMMLSSPFENDELLGVWAICLLMVLGGTDTFTAYRLEDNESWKMLYFQQMLICGYILGLFVSFNYQELKVQIWILFLLVASRVVQRILVLQMANKSLDLKRNNKIIADYMKSLHEHNQQGQLSDATCMEGYHYLVTGEEELKQLPGNIIPILLNDVNTITVEKIWKCKGTLLNNVRDPDGKLKDVCLSFALYKMLRRRFSGHPFAESQDQQTKDFVFKGLISELGDFRRAFRVVEVELGFLYDYFFTKYPFLYLVEKITLILPLLIIIVNFMVVWKLVVWKLLKKVINIESIITVCFVVLLIIFEFSQTIIYLNSDWARVSFICQYVAKSGWQDNPWLEGALRVLCRVPSGKRWQNSLGQYSLFESFNYQPKFSAVPHYLTFGLVDKKRKGQKEPWFVGIPDSVKGEIISALKLTNNYYQMTNGITSLVKNGVNTDLSWACSFQSDTETILVWHVATLLCEINKTDQQNFDHIKVANCLSKYCAYLVAFAPELLPDNKYDSEVIFDSVVKEAKNLLEGTRSMMEIYEKLSLWKEQDHFVSVSKTLFEGTTLATQLINLLDEPKRWQVLAEFWVEMILYITPSDNANDHLKHLTKGGEFLTQLWALFSHAGILERPPKTNRVVDSDGAWLNIR